jgi:hypothetical protein
MNEEQVMIKPNSEENIKLIEIELKIDALSFIELVKNQNLNYKMVPSFFVRTICLTNLNELSPLSDIHFALKNICHDIKKIILVNDFVVPGINQKLCFVEFLSHSSALKSIQIINSYSYPSPIKKILNGDISEVKAYWSEPLNENFIDLFKKTPYVFFENLNVNCYDVFHFKKFIEEKINSLDDNCKIEKIRQYSNKLLICFNRNIPIDIFEQPLFYEDKLIPVIPAMRPNLNVGKYKEKLLKASCYQISDIDKTLLYQLENSMENEILKNKAESAYAKIQAEERRREKDKKMEMGGHKRERDNYDKYDLNKSEKYRVRESDREKDRDREKVRDRRVSDQDKFNKKRMDTPQPNVINQLAGLLSTQNSANLLGNLQQNTNLLGNLQSLQSLLSNPSLITALQGLVNSQTSAPNTSQTKISQQTNLKQIPIPMNISSQSNAPNNQINPVYNIPKVNMHEHQQNMYYQSAMQYQNPNQKMYMPTSQNAVGNQYNYGMGEIYSSPYMGGMNNIPVNNMNNISQMGNMQTLIDYQINQPNDQEADANLMMKKYFEYYQNLNK